MFHLRGAEIAEHIAAGAFAEFRSNRLGNLDSAPYGDEIDILGMTVKKQVTYISAHDIAGARERVGGVAYGMEKR